MTPLTTYPLAHGTWVPPRPPDEASRPCTGYAPPVSLEMINRELDDLHRRSSATEPALRNLLDRWASLSTAAGPPYWLTAARLCELALLTAGDYADGCEFQAAGDLLANPARLLCHIRGRTEPLHKPRHMALSTAINPDGRNRRAFMAWYRTHVMREVAREALLPELTDIMAVSGRFQAAYLEDLARRMAMVADTIGFLAAWQVGDAQDLHLRLGQCTDASRRFIEANLCRFGDSDFIEMGQTIRRLVSAEDKSGVGRTA